MTILLVFFFCILISGSEYIAQDTHAEVKKEQQSDHDDGSSKGETYVSAVVDAVVPFVFAAFDHVFHLIYEVEGYKEFNPLGLVNIQYTNSFFEILLEKIISTNAP